MWRVFYALLVVLSISGCATYSWNHPSKGETEFNQDKFSCTEKSARAFPTMSETRSYGSGTKRPDQTTCYANGNTLNCSTTPGAYTPPFTLSGDANEDNRQDAFNSCMRSMGWASGANSVETIYKPNTQIAKTNVKTANPALESAKEEHKRLEKERSDSCKKDEFKAIFQKSPCYAKDIDLAQLADPSKISGPEKPVFMAWYTETTSRVKKFNAIYKTYGDSGDPKGFKVANLFENAAQMDENNALALYEGKISWGDYNKVRKSTSTSTNATYEQIMKEK